MRSGRSRSATEISARTPGVGEGVWFATVGEEDGYSRAGPGFAGDVGGVDAGICKARDGDITHLITADL